MEKNLDFLNIFEAYKETLAKRNVFEKIVPQDKDIRLFCLKCVLYKFLNGFNSSLAIYLNSREIALQYREELAELKDMFIAVRDFLQIQLFHPGKRTPNFTKGLCSRMGVVVNTLQELRFKLRATPPEKKLEKFIAASLNVIHVIFSKASENDEFMDFMEKLPRTTNFVSDIKELTPFLTLVENGDSTAFICRRIWNVVDDISESNIEDITTPMNVVTDDDNDF